jgi:hypothetical protein
VRSICAHTAARAPYHVDWLIGLPLLASAVLAAAPAPGDLPPWQPVAAIEPPTAPTSTPPSGHVPETMATQPGPSRQTHRPAPFFRCSPGAQPCIRSHPARLVLGVTGVLLAAAGSAYLMVLGDSLKAGDPGAALAGGGALMLGGALLGGLAGLIDGDRASHPDRVRAETIGLGYEFGQAPVLGEIHPGTMQARWAPGWYFPRDRGRLRFTGHVGGLLGREVQVDPRPQAGVFPALPAAKRTNFGFGLDVALALPYPVLGARRSDWLGPVEVRLRPEVHVFRELDGVGSDSPRLVSRTLLLPLTVGLRWHLAARQRLTVLLGPRLDLVAYSETGGPPLRRGPPQVGSVHAEFWYDLDIPFSTTPTTRAGRTRRAAVNSLVSLGYVHSRANGIALSLAATAGYFGSVQAAYRVRVRPQGARYALQFGAGAAIGRTLGAFLEMGVALPDLGTDPRGQEHRRAF